MDSTALATGIQLSVAPVFLLTAVSTLIGALAARLARVVDRARFLEEKLLNQAGDHTHADISRSELKVLQKRISLVNFAITLLVVCAISIGVTILELFLGEIGPGRAGVLSNWVPWTFGAGLAAFIAALMCFLREVLLASKSLNIGKALDSADAR